MVVDVGKSNEWVSDCLMPTQQFFSCIMARTSYFQWDADEVHFVLDQHTKLDFYSASSFKQQSVDRLSDTLSWFLANLSLLFLLYAACLEEKQQIPILYSLELMIYLTWGEHANHGYGL